MTKEGLFEKMPIFGTLNTTLRLSKLAVSQQELPNGGISLCIGYRLNTDNDYKSDYSDDVKEEKTLGETAAKAKNWTPYYYDGPEWKEYAGSVPDVKIDETNFPDAKFRNWVLAQPYGKDGVLTGAEIAGVKDIDVKGKSIQSLKGIEFFTALQYLNCYSNQLTSLDLSNNAELEWLWCFDNKLDSLDLSHCVALKDLSCDNNNITSLDISKNLALRSIDCDKRLAPLIDRSKNENLRWLNSVAIDPPKKPDPEKEKKDTPKPTSKTATKPAPKTPKKK